MRAHALPIQQAGHITAIALGLGGGAGTVIGGVLATQFGQDRPGRTLFWGGVSILVSMPIGLIALQTTSDSLAGITLLAWSFTASLYLCPAYSAMLGTAPAHIRAAAAAATTVLTNLTGIALGPALVGLASDILHHFGDADSLRHALSVAMLFSIIPAALFISLARR
jgi:hypothetical protein